MGTDKINKGLFWGIIASESIHLFCCVLPTVFSILSLLAGMGMIATMPGMIDHLHHLIHDYEIPMMVASGIILVIGWVFYLYSRQINCQTEGTCCHAPCAPKKDRTRIFMIAATMLFIINIGVYFLFHRAMPHSHTTDAAASVMVDAHHHDHGH